MRYNLIFNLMGLSSKYIALIFIMPVIAAIILKEFNQIPPFLITAVLSYFAGILLNLKKVPQKDIDNIKKSESLVAVLFVWVFFAFLCSIPYLFYNFTFSDACFEAVAGVTTTGSTVIQNYDLYPKTLFFYRSLTHWFGGMGIVVLFIAVLPKIAVAGRQMFYAEAPVPVEDKATPRIRFTASWLWGIYFAFTIAEIIVLKLLGLNLFDATLTSLSTISTGGFLHLPNSVADFHNNWVGVCITIFTFIAGMNYILIYRSFKNKRITPVLKSEEFRAYFLIAAILTLFLSASLYFNSHQSALKSFLNASFEIVTTMTSTGFGIDNYVNWDLASKAILFMAFFTGGWGASTSGGIKIIRWVFIFKYLKREINKIIHPQAVYPIKLEGMTVANDVISQLVAFFAFYFAIFASCSFLIILIEKNITVAISSAATAIGNVGPGFGIVGPMGSFASLNIFTKWILIFLMLIGRLEIIPFLAILNKDLWKN